MNNRGDATLEHLEGWFNSAQDRARQRFVTQTRIITIIAAIIVAFGLQLDAFELVKRIAADPDLRSKLVTHIDTLQRDAEVVFQNVNVGDQTAHQAIIEELRKKHPKIGNTLDQRPAFTSLVDVDKWMRDKLQRDSDTDDIVADYKQLFAQQKLLSASKSFERAKADFEKTGIQLIPEPYPPIFVQKWPPSPGWKVFSGQWSWPKRHLFGILVSAVFLSLGAPFWFNVLKSLMSLRPVLAEKIEKESQQKQTPPRFLD